METCSGFEGLKVGFFSFLWMISVGSRDGRKGLGLGFGVGREMDEIAELEEGEAYYYKDGDDDDGASMDPDVALSYLVRVFYSTYHIVILLYFNSISCKF